MAETSMRIMLVVNEFPPQKFAGTAMATQGLALALAERGHEVHVVVTTSYDGAVDGFVQPGVHVSWLKDRPFKGVGIPWRLWLVLRTARQWRPGVMQGQAVSCGLLVSLAGKWLGIPTITYAQGMDVFSSTWMQGKSEISWACSCSTKVLAVTRNLALRLAQVAGMQDVGVLGHGFVPRENRVSRENIRSGLDCALQTPVAVHVGRMDENDKDKGQDILLDAWAKVLQTMPDARLWLVGDGSWRAELEEKAAHLNILHAVLFLGFRPPEAVADYMNAADLFVLPSRFEPYGLVLLEAMYHRLPLVAAEVGGVPEVVAPEGDVWLCPAENPDAMASAIVSGLQQSSYPSEANRAWAVQFTWPEHVGRFESMYKAMVS